MDDLQTAEFMEAIDEVGNEQPPLSGRFIDDFVDIAAEEAKAMERATNKNKRPGGRR